RGVANQRPSLVGQQLLGRSHARGPAGGQKNQCDVIHSSARFIIAQNPHGRTAQMWGERGIVSQAAGACGGVIYWPSRSRSLVSTQARNSRTDARVASRSRPTT